jgi:syntaxin 16
MFFKRLSIKMFNLSQLKIKQIIIKKNRAQKSEQLVMTNVVNSLARSLQELTINFRKSQNTYLNSIYY